MSTLNRHNFINLPVAAEYEDAHLCHYASFRNNGLTVRALPARDPVGVDSPDNLPSTPARQDKEHHPTAPYQVPSAQIEREAPIFFPLTERQIKAKIRTFIDSIDKAAHGEGRAYSVVDQKNGSFNICFFVSRAALVPLYYPGRLQSDHLLSRSCGHKSFLLELPSWRIYRTKGSSVLLQDRKLLDASIILGARQALSHHITDFPSPRACLAQPNGGMNDASRRRPLLQSTRSSFHISLEAPHRRRVDLVQASTRTDAETPAARGSCRARRPLVLQPVHCSFILLASRSKMLISVCQIRHMLLAQLTRSLRRIMNQVNVHVTWVAYKLQAHMLVLRREGAMNQSVRTNKGMSISAFFVIQVAAYLKPPQEAGRFPFTQAHYTRATTKDYWSKCGPSTSRQGRHVQVRRLEAGLQCYHTIKVLVFTLSFSYFYQKLPHYAQTIIMAYYDTIRSSAVFCKQAMAEEMENFESLYKSEDFDSGVNQWRRKHLFASRSKRGTSLHRPSDYGLGYVWAALAELLREEHAGAATFQEDRVTRQRVPVSRYGNLVPTASVQIGSSSPTRPDSASTSSESSTGFIPKQSIPLVEDITVRLVSCLIRCVVNYAQPSSKRSPFIHFRDWRLISIYETVYEEKKVRATDDGGLQLYAGEQMLQVASLEGKRSFHAINKNGKPTVSDQTLSQFLHFKIPHEFIVKYEKLPTAKLALDTDYLVLGSTEWLDINMLDHRKEIVSHILALVAWADELGGRDMIDGAMDI
ncbi:hypothetical protein HRG_012502 [Hirsutella rhossiliensis]